MKKVIRLTESDLTGIVKRVIKETKSNKDDSSIQDKIKMKKISTEEEFRLLYGGNNKQNPPFNVGDKLKQIWRVDNNNLIKDGREEFEFVGMKDDLMLLKTLNIYASYSEDTINPLVLKQVKKAGFKPIIGDIKQLHYMYADRYDVVG